MIVSCMQIANSKIEELKTMLLVPQNIVILSHTNPDGDAIGSSLAWAEILSSKGHNVKCIVPNRFPYYLEFMPYNDTIVIYKDDKILVLNKPSGLAVQGGTNTLRHTSMRW